MRLEFQKIIIRDFKRYRGKHVLDVGKLGNGLHYIRGDNQVHALGSNGAGKSTIWDAFQWCLTGKTTRGLRGTDVRTWGGDKPASVAVTFFKDDDGHIIKRSTKTNGLWLDGKLTSQDEIDRLILLNASTIPHTIILGQKRDLFFDLKPAQKLDVISDVLLLDKWERRSKRAKDRVGELRIELAKTDTQLIECEKAMDAARDTLEDLKKQSRAWEDERSQGEGKREEEIEKLKKARARFDREKGDHDLAYESAETELRAVRKDVLKLAPEMSGLVARVAKYKAEMDQTKRRLEELDDISDVCPTCGQEIADKKEAKAHAKKERGELTDALDLSRTRYRKWADKRDELQARIDRMQDAEKDFATKSDDAKDKFDHCKTSIANIDQEIAVRRARSRQDETNPFQDSIRRARDIIKDGKVVLLACEEKQDLLSSRIARTKYWIDGFKQVRLYLLQEVLEELQEVTQNMLPDFGLSGWSVQYDIERETKSGTISTGINVSILQPGMHRPVKWEAWSGGENQRLLIVGALAFADVLMRNAGVECDMIVLDEPTRHMSKEGVADMIDHLVSMGRDRQVFYCDHAAVESTRFASVITVTKDKKGSHIEIE